MDNFPEGKVLVKTEGQIVIAKYIGTFNESGIHQQLEAVKEAVKGFGDKPFAMLVDVQFLVGGTPEAYEISDNFNRWLNTRNLIAKATVFQSKVKLKIIDARVISKKHQNHASFNNLGEARGWLKTQLKEAELSVHWHHQLS